MKKIFFIAWICILLQSDFLAQEGGSYYTRYGLGDFYYSYTARRLGMGELGIAASDRDFLSSLNPASWNQMRLTRFETGLIYKGSVESSTQSEAFFSQTVFSGMLIGFPVSHENGIGVVTGIVPYSNVNYETSQQMDSNFVDQYTLSYKGEGGLSKAFIGLSYRLPFDFSIGSSFEYYTGKIQYTTKFDFVSTSTFYDGSYIKEYYYHGVGFTVGLISSNIGKALGVEKIKDLRVGITFSSQVSLSTDTVSSSSTSVGVVQNSTQSYKTKLPFRLGVGLSMNWDENYDFILDYLFMPLSQFEQNNIPGKNMRDAYKLSLGLEHSIQRPGSQSFWEHVMWRAGISYEQTQYIFNGNGINQASVYAGLSVPMGFDNSVDFGFQYGKRGTKENNLLSENIYKFSISLSIGELWFIRQER